MSLSSSFVSALDPRRRGSKRPPAWPTLWRVLLLGLAGGAINLHAPTVFFDSQIMLGGALVVLALLRFGWPGLAAGLLALGGTALRWGHPFELIIGMMQYAWLLIFLKRLNGGRRNNDNGRVVLAAAGFWLLLGMWMEVALFHYFFGLSTVDALGLGLKESVVGIINAALGLLLLHLTRLGSMRRGVTVVSARGATFALTLTLIVVPSVSMVIMMSGQLRTVELRSQLKDLQHLGLQAADAYQPNGQSALPFMDAGMAFELAAGGKPVWSSDPGFFEKLDASHTADRKRAGFGEDLTILKPREGGPVVKVDQNSYWMAHFDVPGPEGPLNVRVTQQAAALIREIDYGLLVPAFSLLLGLLVLGVLGSELAALAVGRRFERILEPATAQQTRKTGIRELDEVLTLAGGTRLARQELHASETRYRNFFNLPLVGTAITSRTKGWVAVNDRTCEILGYSREELFRKTWAVLTHPEDLAEDQAQFERLLRREIDGYQLEKRFLRKDGTVVHTLLAGGCGAIGSTIPDFFYVNILDITRRQEIEAELAAAREREKAAEEHHRTAIERKLKTSLHAAAVAHEINQPLSRIILRARMENEKPGPDREKTLQAFLDDAENVVATISKMKSLLRNVETHQRPVSLKTIVHSTLLQVKRLMTEHNITVHHHGPTSEGWVMGDDVQIQMALTNILRNSAEAIIASNTRRREISIERIEHPDSVEVVVGDSGPGWPGGSLNEAILQTTKPGGSGVGLFIVKTAIENHRGQIHISRSPLGGAQFHLLFPLTKQRNY